MTDLDTIRVLIVDDHDMVRQGLVVFLQAFDDLVLVGEASNGEDALRQCEALSPNVVLMDMVMPGGGGVKATRNIKARFPQIQVLGLSSFSDDHELVQNALQAGVTGFVFKSISIDEMAHAIRKTAAGEPFLSPEATRMLIAASTQPSPKSFNLTARELEVLGLLTEGLRNAEIAERMGVSQSTAKFHVSSVLGKLGVTSRTEAVSIALQYNLVS